jgi:hypothetical protein
VPKYKLVSNPSSQVLPNVGSAISLKQPAKLAVLGPHVVCPICQHFSCQGMAQRLSRAGVEFLPTRSFQHCQGVLGSAALHCLPPLPSRVAVQALLGTLVMHTCLSHPCAFNTAQHANIFEQCLSHPDGVLALALCQAVLAVKLSSVDRVSCPATLL